MLWRDKDDSQIQTVFFFQSVVPLSVLFVGSTVLLRTEHHGTHDFNFLFFEGFQRTHKLGYKILCGHHRNKIK